MHPVILDVKTAIVEYAKFDDKNVRDALLSLVTQIGEDLQEADYITTVKTDKLRDELSDIVEQTEPTDETGEEDDS